MLKYAQGLVFFKIKNRVMLALTECELNGVQVYPTAQKKRYCNVKVKSLYLHKLVTF